MQAPHRNPPLQQKRETRRTENTALSEEEMIQTSKTLIRRGFDRVKETEKRGSSFDRVTADKAMPGPLAASEVPDALIRGGFAMNRLQPTTVIRLSENLCGEPWFTLTRSTTWQ
ncbi:hypothetical protein N7520_008612 [Penicillium odoratum]|uniref:uncharacterized protein n=1 Tax=Penicillium odoratum TaxID=1167516 RepID=UPI00254837E3|nr:uncharacterized protein N7520_008612 [Penicillium odoratum]KAJ5751695.1 hypothetical protein N7520_008612 [Penicillium odoratum]